ncbi:MAG: efflux RND transporter periplasmic adaptor subunit [Bacteroidia bacterium]|nr:efflux RND transporter periplasmic adaptor subunit [Bacteroidia bacterium]
MKKNIIITAGVVIVIIVAIIVYNRLTSKKGLTNLYVEAQKGQFDIVVTTTGELQAEHSTDIYGPEFTQSRNIRAMDIKITDLVPEGTEVKAGDYIATLDRTSFDNSLKDELERLKTAETNLEVKILDTAVNLSNLRDNIKNLRFSVEEAEITLQQSKYEPPTTIRQAEISLDKTNRSLEQSLRGYSLKVEQARSDMRTIKTNLAEERQRVADLQTVLSKFIISAPASGMVIYKRDRTGAKRKVGSSISPWDNVVATLPDMTSMISKTYVNEIDVSKVKAGQRVDIMVDAFPEKKYTGTVTSVANIGEQLPNTDSKVFEVQIKVDGTDLILRPSMTTGNKIVTKTINDVTFIALECVQTGTDSIPFVYLKDGDKQVVVLGESNENNVIVEQGIEPGTQLYLNTPENPEKFTKLLGENLISVIKEKENAKKEAERKSNEEAQRSFGGRGDMMGMPPDMMGQFPNMGGGMQQGGQGGRTMDTAAVRRFRQMRENMTPAQRDSLRKRFSRSGNQQGGTRQSNQQNQQNQEGRRNQQNQQTQQTQQTTINR